MNLETGPGSFQKKNHLKSWSIMSPFEKNSYTKTYRHKILPTPRSQKLRPLRGKNLEAIVRMLRDILRNNKAVQTAQAMPPRRAKKMGQLNIALACGYLIFWRTRDMLNAKTHPNLKQPIHNIRTLTVPNILSFIVYRSHLISKTGFIHSMSTKTRNLQLWISIIIPPFT